VGGQGVEDGDQRGLVVAVVVVHSLLVHKCVQER
jgi:hypothetical protein